VKHAAVVLESRRRDDAVRIGPSLAAEALDGHAVTIPGCKSVLKSISPAKISAIAMARSMPSPAASID
jgi:hypothetical protein